MKKMIMVTTALTVIGGSLLVVNPEVSNAYKKVDSHTVIVQKGDTLTKIAKGNNTSVSELKQLNNLKSSKIYVGQKLVVGKITTTHTVKKGETLYGISKKYKTTVATVKKLNGLKSDTIKVGQKLIIKGTAVKPVETLPKTKKIEVIVEGSKEMRDAILFKSTLGYNAYVLKNFKATAEEPNKDIVFFKNDDSFFMRIEKLDNTTTIDQLKAQSKDLIKHNGTPQELTIMSTDKHIPSGTKFLIHSSNSKLSINVAVIEVSGQKYRVFMSLPNKEAAEGVTPSMWAMLKTMTK